MYPLLRAITLTTRCSSDEPESISFLTTEIYGGPSEVSHITEMSLDDTRDGPKGGIRLLLLNFWEDNSPECVLRYIMQDYNQFYKPKQPTLGTLANKYYEEVKDELCDKLQSGT